MDERNRARFNLDDVPTRRIADGSPLPEGLDPRRTLAVAAACHGPRKLAKRGYGEKALRLGHAFGHFDHVG